LYKELEEFDYTLHIHQSPSEASSEHHRTTELHRAARRGDLDTVRFLTEEEHQNPLQKDEKGDMHCSSCSCRGREFRHAQAHSIFLFLLYHHGNFPLIVYVS